MAPMLAGAAPKCRSRAHRSCRGARQPDVRSCPVCIHKRGSGRDHGGVRSPVVVVGAGAAGLAVSRALVGAGLDHLVLERHDVGDTWKTQRWDSFRLNTPGWMNAAVGTVAPTSFPFRDEVVQLLGERAASLPVRTHTPVVEIDHNGSRFLVR